MTVAATITSKQYTGNGATSQFSFPNKVFAATDLVVTLIDTLGNQYPFINFLNVATGLSYTVQNVDVDTGCLVTFSAAITNLWTIDIRSATPQTQSTSVKNQGAFLPELHEEAFDRATRMIQDLLRLTYLYGIHGSDLETVPWPALPLPSVRKGFLLGFDGSTGLPTLATGTNTTVTQGLIGQLLYPTQGYESGVVNNAYPVGNVLRYGADPTGALDSTAAINAAIASVHNSPAGGGRVYLPAGTYLVGSVTQINFVLNNIYLVGDGIAATQIVNASANQPAVTIGNGITPLFHCGILGMNFTQKSGVTALNGNCAFFFFNLSQFIVRDVSITNATGAPFRGCFIENCGEFFVYNLFVQSCLNDGITLEGTTDAFMMACNSNSNAGAGYVLNATQGGEFLGCYAFNNTGAGWGLVSGAPASAPNLNNAFFDCVGDTSGSHNWLISDSFDSWWVGCWGSTQISKLVNTSACGFQITGQYCVNLKFIGCLALNNNSHGIQVFDTGASAPQKIEFIGCQFGSASPSADGNGQAAGGGYGFSCNATVSHIRINGGTFDGNATGPAQFSISGSFASQDITISGNPIGLVASNEGNSSVTIGNTSVTVTHGLGFTPNLTNIQVTPTSSAAASSITSWWISNPTSTTFQLNTNAAVAGANFNFVWRASFHGT